MEKFELRIIFNIELDGITDPKIWRRIAIPANMNFEKLHKIIQTAMGWKNQHLFTFSETKRPQYFFIKSKHLEDNGGIDAHKVEILPILIEYYNVNLMKDEKHPKDYLYYTYDMGDRWLHRIEIENIEHTNNQIIETLDGGGACPPENCGGIPGYQRIKSYLAGKMSKTEYDDWFSAVDVQKFDPNHLDIEATNLRLMKLN